MFKNVGKLACFQKKLSERYDNHLLILRVEVSEYLKATINVLATSKRFIMGLLSRLKKATGLESSLEPEPKPKPKDSPIMTESRQPVPDGALEADGERQQKSFWKWAALHFPSRRTGTCDLAKAEEKYGIEAGTHWRDSYGIITSNIDKSLNLNPPFHKKASHQTF